MPTDLLVVDSVTRFGPEARGAVAIAASHGGVLAVHMALASGIVGVLLNDAGVGREGAGIGGLAYADRFGAPCATIDHRSARIGDGADHAARGLVSYANVAAGRLGVRVGMPAHEAADLLRAAELAPVDPGPPPQETRHVVTLPGAARRLVLIDSASMVLPEDAGAVVFTGSHGGLLGRRPETAIKHNVFAAIYNDAGIGIDEAGVSRLPALDARGVAGVTVAAASARIGEARSTWATGVLSRVNRKAAQRGAREGMSARDFASLMCNVAL
jgi:hypothetical protein